MVARCSPSVRQLRRSLPESVGVILHDEKETADAEVKEEEDEAKEAKEVA